MARDRHPNAWGIGLMNSFLRSRWVLLSVLALLGVGGWMTFAQETLPPPAGTSPGVTPSDIGIGAPAPVAGNIGVSPPPPSADQRSDVNVTPPAPEPAPALPENVKSANSAVNAAISKEQNRYRNAEDQARRTASQILSNAASQLDGNTNRPMVREQDRAALKNNVRESFEARQELLRQEIKLFRDRLDKLSHMLEVREQSKESIIEHRVDDLLNPELNWGGDDNSPDPGPPSPPPLARNQKGKPKSGRGLPLRRTDAGSRSPAASPAGSGEAPAQRAEWNDNSGDVPQDNSSSNAALDFLKTYPDLINLSLKMSTDEFKTFVKRHGLTFREGVHDKGRTIYMMPTGDGHEIVIEIQDGKIRSIQRIRAGLPANNRSSSAPPVGQPGVNKSDLKIFGLNHAEAQAVSDKLKELAGDDSFTMRCEVNQATNSLIIFAQPEDLETIQVLIQYLDKAPVKPKTSNRTASTQRFANPDADSAQTSSAPALGTNFSADQQPTPVELQLQLSGAESELAEARSVVANALTELRKTRPEATEQDIAQLKDGNWDRLVASKKLQEEIHARYAAVLKLLEAKLQTSRAELAAEEARLSQSQSRSKLDNKAKLLAKLEVEKYQALLSNLPGIDERAASSLDFILLPPIDSEYAASSLCAMLGIEIRAVARDALTDQSYSGGVQITSIQADSTAAKAGLKVDDVIVAADTWAIEGGQQLFQALTSGTRSAAGEPGNDLRLRVLRGKSVVRLLIPRVQADKPEQVPTGINQSQM